jgi:hypothetical protein
MHEPLPLATIHDAVLEFLQGRDDAVLFGAQAVNAYVDVPRMTQDVDVASVRGAELAEELRQHLADRFRIAVRVWNVREGLGYRVYQVRKDGNRHLVDVRPVNELPLWRRMQGFLVVEPAELIAGKVLASVSRAGKEKGYTDLRDLLALMRTFPDLKTVEGPVRERLDAGEATPEVIRAWEAFVAQQVPPEEDDGW